MVIIDGKPTVIAGYDDRIVDSVEEFNGTHWNKRGHLEKGTYQYAMPSTLPEDTFSCTN